MAETYTGQVQNGVIVLDEGSPPLREGMKVRVEPAGPDSEGAASNLSRVLLEFAGTVRGLPPDMAEQHDHYLHGTPRR